MHGHKYQMSHIMAYFPCSQAYKLHDKWNLIAIVSWKPHSLYTTKENHSSSGDVIYSPDIYYHGVCLNVSACFSSAPSISPSLSSFHKIYSTGRAKRRLLISLKSSCLSPRVETAHGREGKMHTKSEIIIFALQKCKTKGNRLAGGKYQILPPSFVCRCDRERQMEKEKEREMPVQALLINLHIPNRR